MTNNKTRVVFKMNIAAKLIDKGHEVVEILPNPQKPRLKMWVFAVDDTFDEDFRKLREEDVNGRQSVQNY